MKGGTITFIYTGSSRYAGSLCGSIIVRWGLFVVDNGEEKEA